MNLGKNIKFQLIKGFYVVVLMSSVEPCDSFVGHARQGKDIVFRFIIKYSKLRDFGLQVINRSSRI
jgi:hypothetical protein